MMLVGKEREESGKCISQSNSAPLVLLNVCKGELYDEQMENTLVRKNLVLFSIPRKEIIVAIISLYSSFSYLFT